MKDVVPFACDMSALSSEQRLRHGELEGRLRALVRGIGELGDGYEFEFLLHSETQDALTEITSLERLCCPFFDVSIRLEGDRLWWRLTGREGVKPFIRAEFSPWFGERSL